MDPREEYASNPYYVELEHYGLSYDEYQSMMTIYRNTLASEEVIIPAALMYGLWLLAKTIPFMALIQEYGLGEGRYHGLATLFAEITRDKTNYRSNGR